MISTAIGTALIGLFVAWVFGGVILRLLGLALLLAGTLGLALWGEANGVLLALIGAVLWLAGHGHYALRHEGRSKSPLASAVFAALAACFSAAMRTFRGAADPDPFPAEERKEGP